MWADVFEGHLLHPPQPTAEPKRTVPLQGFLAGEGGRQDTATLLLRLWLALTGAVHLSSSRSARLHLSCALWFLQKQTVTPACVISVWLKPTWLLQARPMLPTQNPAENP